MGWDARLRMRLGCIARCSIGGTVILPPYKPTQNKTKQNTQMPLPTLMQRWKPEPLYQSSAPEVGDWPFSPVQSARKFWVGFCVFV